MARIARVVVPGVPHHVVQRGNRRQPVFFRDADYELYVGLVSEWCRKYAVEVWAYCLMPNHVHLIAVPDTALGLARAVGEAHRRYTQLVNQRERWTGYLWQGRFSSYPLDEPHLLMAVRYVEQNPVRARIVRLPWKYPWSSAAAHVSGQDDRLVHVKPMLELVDEDWPSYLAERTGEADNMLLRQHSRTGRPLGDTEFIETLEHELRRRIGLGKRGRPRKASEK